MDKYESQPGWRDYWMKCLFHWTKHSIVVVCVTLATPFVWNWWDSWAKQSLIFICRWKKNTFKFNQVFDHNLIWNHCKLKPLCMTMLCDAKVFFLNENNLAKIFIQRRKQKLGNENRMIFPFLSKQLSVYKIICYFSYKGFSFTVLKF